MNPERLHYLMQQYIKDECTKEELEELLAFIKNERNQDWLRDELKNYWEASPSVNEDASEWDKRFFVMMEESKARTGLWEREEQPAGRPWWKIAAAVLSLCVLTAGMYYWLGQNQQAVRQPLAANIPAAEFEHDVPPGGDKAILTLANGSKIILDSLHNGSVANQGNSKILKMDSGKLVYHATAANIEEVVTYNTISTPWGGQYEVVLADGSKVWLNAASSLRFPASFSGKNREVELTGEGYFEIAADKEKPFVVQVGGTSIDVLGTHFNVMAYDMDKGMKTTLLEGAVRMKYNTVTAVLKPGQQATVDTDKGNIKVADGDVDEAVAWKNGLFQFNNSSLETIMDQIARWYNVEVVYEDDMPERRFTGKMSRNVSLQHVLKVLELSKVKFKLEGRKILVLQ